MHQVTQLHSRTQTHTHACPCLITGFGEEEIWGGMKVKFPPQRAVNIAALALNSEQSRAKGWRRSFRNPLLHC